MIDAEEAKTMGIEENLLSQSSMVTAKDILWTMDAPHKHLKKWSGDGEAGG